MGILDAGENEASFIEGLSQQYLDIARLFNSSANLVFDSETDVLNGTNGNDILVSGSGNDTLNGGTGDDTLIGNEGNDNINGGGGNDTFVWNLGDGNDIISDYRYQKAANNETGVLRFGEGVAAENMELKRVGDNAVFIVGETGEQVTVQDWYAHADFQLTSVEFADTAVWTRADVNDISDQPNLAASGESSLGEYFNEEENRKSA
jgi:Ca2+-binding RTX toxin-like protein